MRNLSTGSYSNTWLAILLAIVGCLFACGGGGGGSGDAGNRAVLRILNVSESIANLSVSIDSELAFPQLAIGEASPYESVLQGARLVQLFDTLKPDLKAELINEFSISIPYTIILSGPNSSLKTLLAINDRSDSPPGQFRVRAVNANTSGSTLRVLLIPAKVSTRLNLSSVSTNTASPNMAAPVSSVLAAVLPTAVPSTTVPSNTVSPAASAVASATAVVSPTELPSLEVSLSDSLENQQIGAYRQINRGDYKIVVEQGEARLYSSEAITFNPGQVESIVISNNSSSIIRLNDKPN